MNIAIKIDLKKTLEQLETIKKFKESLPSNKMYFRYPDNLNLSLDFDSEKFKYKNEQLLKEW